MTQQHIAATGVLPPGTVLGRYELIRQIAVGGMAELHLARARSIEGFQKLVVLKRILPHYAQNPRFVEMFLDEARLAATLHHPNIAQVYDIGIEQGNYFFAMEYVHGEDLRRLSRDEARIGIQMPLTAAIAIMAGVCTALHYAHEKKGPNGKALGLVHRDVSPHNVLVSYDGQVKLVDFGIAKAAGGRHVTDTESLKGKIAYMSPEQCLAKKMIDRRSDIFAAGILLYELTTGTRLFKGENDYSILKRIVEEPVPPPSSRRSDYPEALEQIVVRCLAREAEDRYATAQAMQIALQEFALEARLSTSSVALGWHMEELYGERLDEWRAAQESGQSLEETVVKTIIDSAPRKYQLPDEATSPGFTTTELRANRSRRAVLPMLAVVIAVALAVGLYSQMGAGESDPAPATSGAAEAVTGTEAEGETEAGAETETEAEGETEAEVEAVPATDEEQASAEAEQRAEAKAKEAAKAEARAKKADARRRKRKARRRSKEKWDVNSPLLPR